MDEDKRERLSCLCPVCGTEFWACKSIFQEHFGLLDKGLGRCPRCNTLHNLTVDENNKRMIVKPLKDYFENMEGGK